MTLRRAAPSVRETLPFCCAQHRCSVWFINMHHAPAYLTIICTTDCLVRAYGQPTKLCPSAVRAHVRCSGLGSHPDRYDRAEYSVWTAQREDLDGVRGALAAVGATTARTRVRAGRWPLGQRRGNNHTHNVRRWPWAGGLRVGAGVQSGAAGGAGCGATPGDSYPRSMETA